MRRDSALSGCADRLAIESQESMEDGSFCAGKIVSCILRLLPFVTDRILVYVLRDSMISCIRATVSDWYSQQKARDKMWQTRGMGPRHESLC